MTLHFGHKSPGAVNDPFLDAVFIDPELLTDLRIAVITPFKQQDLLAGVWQTTECGPEKVFIQPDFGWFREGKLVFLAITPFAGGIQHRSNFIIRH